MSILKRLLSLKPQGVSSAERACSTRMVNDQFFVCKVKRPSPKYCEYSLSMGDGYICKHHDRSRFVEK